MSPELFSSSVAKAAVSTSSLSVLASFSPIKVRNMVKLMGPVASATMSLRYLSSWIFPDRDYFTDAVYDT